MSEICKCIETGKIYPSIKRAANMNNISLSSINRALANHSHTAGNYHWVLIKEDGEIINTNKFVHKI